MLNARQRAFVREYLLDHNGKQAAIRAGYSPNGASVHATRLLADASVRRAVEAGDARINEHSEMAAAEVLRILDGMIRDEKLAPAVKVRCLELRLRVLGMLKDQVNHTGLPESFTLRLGEAKVRDE